MRRAKGSRAELANSRPDPPVIVDQKVLTSECRRRNGDWPRAKWREDGARALVACGGPVALRYGGVGPSELKRGAWYEGLECSRVACYEVVFLGLGSPESQRGGVPRCVVSQGLGDHRVRVGRRSCVLHVPWL